MSADRAFIPKRARSHEDSLGAENGIVGDRHLDDRADPAGVCRDIGEARGPVFGRHGARDVDTSRFDPTAPDRVEVKIASAGYDCPLPRTPARPTISPARASSDTPHSFS